MEFSIAREGIGDHHGDRLANPECSGQRTTQCKMIHVIPAAHCVISSQIESGDILVGNVVRILWRFAVREGCIQRGMHTPASLPRRP